MKTATGSQNSNDRFLPFLLSIQVTHFQKQHRQLTPDKKTSNILAKIISLRFKQQIQWIRRHRHQTVLSRKNLLLPVCFVLITLKSPSQLEHHVHSFVRSFVIRLVSLFEILILSSLKCLKSHIKRNGN